MNKRKGKIKAPSLALLFITFGVFLATYNLITHVVHYHPKGMEGRLPNSHSSILQKVSEVEKTSNGFKRLFHVAVTATGTTYSKWQCRIMYYWYKKVKDGHGSEMGGFTRILHSGEPDSLMDEIPTFVVKPLQDGIDQGYIVLNRPWAFVQWLQEATINEEYVLMAEPDHIFVHPLPNLAHGNYPSAFPFSYIRPSAHENLLRKFYPEKNGPLTNIDPIGNSPVIIHKSQLERIAPTWLNISLKMKNDPETDKTFGWVLEMYGYAVASALHGVKHILYNEFMIQPPWDVKVANAYIIHYTYGCQYTLKGELIVGKFGEWGFDKRFYRHSPPPRNLSLPPPGVPDSLVTLIKMINEATQNLLEWNATK